MLSFENNAHRTKPTEYFLSTEEIEDYNVIIDGKIFFDQPVKKDFRTYENIRKMQLVKEMITQLVFYLKVNCNRFK